MRKLYQIILIALAVSISVNADAQRLKVKERHGEIVKSKRMLLSDFEPSAGGEYIMTSPIAKMQKAAWIKYSNIKIGYDLMVTTFDDKLNEVADNEIELNYGNKRCSYESLVKFGGRYLLFFSYGNLKRNKFYLFYHEIDPETGEIEGSTYKVAETKMGRKGYSDPKMIIKRSPDKSKLVILGIPPQRLPKRSFFGRNPNSSESESSGGYATMSFWVMNRQMETVNYQKNYKMSLEGKGKFYITDVKVANDNSVFVIGQNRQQEFLNKPERKKKKTKSRSTIKKLAYLINKVDQSGEEVSYVTEEEILLQDMEFEFSPDGQHLYGMGLVGEEFENMFLTKRTYVLKLSTENLDEISAEEFPYDDVVYEQSQRSLEEVTKNRRKEKKKKKEKPKKKYAFGKKAIELPKDYVPNLKNVVGIIFDKDGNPMMVAEKKWVVIVTTTTTNSNGTTSSVTNYYYHYGDAIIAKFDGADVTSNIVRKHGWLANYDIGNGMSLNSNDEGLFMLANNAVFKVDFENMEVSSTRFGLYNRKGRPLKKERKTRATKGDDYPLVDVGNYSLTHATPSGPNKFICKQIFGTKRYRIVEVSY